MANETPPCPDQSSRNTIFLSLLTARGAVEVTEAETQGTLRFLEADDVRVRRSTVSAVGGSARRTKAGPLEAQSVGDATEHGICESLTCIQCVDVWSLKLPSVHTAGGLGDVLDLLGVVRPGGEGMAAESQGGNFQG